MSLAPGTHIGAYEVIGLVGAGGMGEVYRARDTRLNRDVAIKILPDTFAADAERIARFQREAQVLASLNHPNIAQIYGVEHAGPSTSSGQAVSALILEFVDGPTLADRIAQGAIPLDEALAIAKQIAEALEAAHEQGVIHRDLKPANIKLKLDGVVKVLDFGLAKALVSEAAAANVSMSPTITSPVMSGQGMILGSAAYMSPEQARGKAVDKRSDVWAFGCVLYEMLTGRRVFDGDDVTDVLAFIITREPDLAALPAKTPSAIRKLLTRCLAKDRKKRLADMSDARLEIDEGIATPWAEALPSTNAGSAAPSRRTLSYVIAVGLASAALTAVAVWSVVGTAPAAERPLQKLTIHIPASAQYLGGTGGDLAVSRDGTRLVFSGREGSRRILYIRDLAELEPQPIRGSEDGYSPFFSPDGEWVAFFTEPGPTSGKLKKVPVRGGSATTLCDAPAPHGGVWTDEATIIFSARGTGGLFKVPEAGGQSVPVTTLDPKTEVRHGWPDVLPNGKTVLFSILPRRGLYDSARIAVYSLADGSTKTIVPSGYHGRYVPSGHIVYVASANSVSAGRLMAVPFDTDSLTIAGASVPVVESVMTGVRTIGSAGFGVSRSGFMAYVPGATSGDRRSLVWVDRRGREEPIAAPARPYVYARLSPDGTRVALDVRDEQNDIWVWSLARQTLVRVTKDAGIDRFPAWSADGTRVLYSSPRRGNVDNIYSQAADGTGEAERIIESQTAQRVQTVTRDGSQLILRVGAGGSDSVGGLSLLSLTGTRALVPLMQPPAGEINAELSPDGKWLAYQSLESGRDEVYVRPFPDVNSAKFLVSTAGGSRPLWARSGRELFYLSGSTTGPVTVMAMPIKSGPTFWAGTPQKVFEGRYAGLNVLFVARSYDVSPDGAKFLMIKDETPDESSTPSAFVIVLNFFDELKRLAPSNP